MSANESTMDAAVILAAGSGRRMRGAVEDKALAPLAGRPVFLHSVDAFLESGSVGEMVFVFRDDAQQKALEQSLLGVLPETIGCRFVQGGAERALSVAKGLDALQPDTRLVFIHDAARPLIHASAIRDLRQLAESDGAAALAHAVTDTIKRLPQSQQLRRTRPEDLDRSRLWAMETPQAFDAATIRLAYAKALRQGCCVTDDAAALTVLGRSVSLLENTRPNPKLTSPQDFAYAEWLLRSRISG